MPDYNIQAWTAESPPRRLQADWFPYTGQGTGGYATSWPQNYTWTTSGPVTFSYTNGTSQTVSATSITMTPITAERPNEMEVEMGQELTEEERAEQEGEREAARQRIREQQERARREYQERDEQRRRATERAEALLRRHLSNEQRAQYDEHKWFEVQIGQRTYRITEGREGNVYLMVGGRRVVSYCIHPDQLLPWGDQMLTQLLWLETNEAEFLRVANASRLEGGVAIPPAQCDEELDNDEEAA